MKPGILRNALFLIWLGVFILFINLDRLSWNFFWWVALTFWPLLLVSWGWEKVFSSPNLKSLSYLSSVILMLPLTYVLVAASKEGTSRENYFEYQLEKKPEWSRLNLSLKLRSNNLYFANDPNRFVYGDFDYLLARPDIDLKEKEGIVELALSDRDWFWPVGRWRAFRDRNWEVTVNDSIPLSLTVKTGKGDAELDARFLQLEKLAVKGGADDVSIKLGSKFNNLEVSLNLPKADVEIFIPESAGIEAAGKIDFGKLGGSFWSFSQKGKSFYSDNYDRARLKIKLNFSKNPVSLDLQAD